jgi:hypothetical protein
MDLSCMDTHETEIDFECIWGDVALALSFDQGGGFAANEIRAVLTKPLCTLTFTPLELGTCKPNVHRLICGAGR